MSEFNLVRPENDYIPVFGSSGNQTKPDPKVPATPFINGIGYTEKLPKGLTINQLNDAKVKIEKELLVGGGTNIQALYLTEGDNKSIGLENEHLNTNHLMEFASGERVKVIGTLNAKDIRGTKLKVNPIVLGHFVPTISDPNGDVLSSDTKEIRLEKSDKLHPWKLKYLSFHYLEAKKDDSGKYCFNLRELRVNRLVLPEIPGRINTLSTVQVSISLVDVPIKRTERNGKITTHFAPGFNVVIAQLNAPADGALGVNTWGFFGSQYGFYTKINASEEFQRMKTGIMCYIPGTSFPFNLQTIPGSNDQPESVGLLASVEKKGLGYDLPFDYHENITLDKQFIESGGILSTIESSSNSPSNNSFGFVLATPVNQKSFNSRSHVENNWDIDKDNSSLGRHLIIYGAGLARTHDHRKGTVIHGLTVLGNGKYVKDSYTYLHANHRINNLIGEVDQNLTETVIVGGVLDSVDNNRDKGLTRLHDLKYPLSVDSFSSYVFGAVQLIKSTDVSVGVTAKKTSEFTTIPITIYVLGGREVIIYPYDNATGIDQIPVLGQLTGGKLISSMENFLGENQSKITSIYQIPVSYGIKNSINVTPDKIIDLNVPNNTNGTITEQVFKAGVLDYPLNQNNEVGKLPFLKLGHHLNPITFAETPEGIELGDNTSVIVKNKTTANDYNLGSPTIVSHVPFIDRREASVTHGLMYASRGIERNASGLTHYFDSLTNTEYLDPTIRFLDHLVNIDIPKPLIKSNILPTQNSGVAHMPPVTSTQVITGTKENEIECLTLITNANDNSTGVVTNGGRSVSTFTKSMNEVGFEFTTDTTPVKSLLKVRESNDQSTLDVIDFYRLNMLVNNEDEKSQDNYLFIHKERNDNKILFTVFMQGDNTNGYITEFNCPQQIDGLNKYTCSFVHVGDKNGIQDNILSSPKYNLHLYPGSPYYNFLKPNHPTVNHLGYDPFDIMSVGAFVYMASPTKGSVTDVRIFYVPVVIVRGKGLIMLSAPKQINHSANTDVSDINPSTSTPIESRLKAFIQMASISGDPTRPTPIPLNVTNDNRAVFFNYLYLDVFYSRNHAGSLKTTSTLLYCTKTTNIFTDFLKFSRGTGNERSVESVEIDPSRTDAVSEGYKLALSGATEFRCTTYRLTTTKEDRNKYEKFNVLNVGPKNYLITYLHKYSYGNPSRLKATILGRSIFVGSGGEFAMSVERPLLPGVDPRYYYSLLPVDTPDKIVDSSIMLTDASYQYLPKIIGIIATANSAYEDLANPFELKKSKGKIIGTFIHAYYNQMTEVDPIIAVKHSIG